METVYFTLIGCRSGSWTDPRDPSTSCGIGRSSPRSMSALDIRTDRRRRHRCSNSVRYALSLRDRREWPSVQTSIGFQLPCDVPWLRPLDGARVRPAVRHSADRRFPPALHSGKTGSGRVFRAASSVNSHRWFITTCGSRPVGQSHVLVAGFKEVSRCRKLAVDDSGFARWVPYSDGINICFIKVIEIRSEIKRFFFL